ISISAGTARSTPKERRSRNSCRNSFRTMGRMRWKVMDRKPQAAMLGTPRLVEQGSRGMAFPSFRSSLLIDQVNKYIFERGGDRFNMACCNSMLLKNGRNKLLPIAGSG